MGEELIEPNNSNLVKRPDALTTEIVDSSDEIFREAIGNIPPLKYGWQTAYAVSGIALYMGEFEPETSALLIDSVRNEIIETFPPERTVARSLLNLMQTELGYGWDGFTKTGDALIQTIDDGVPPDKKEGWYVDVVQAVARHSANSARELVAEKFPWWVDSDMQLQIAEVELRKDPQSAGEKASDYLKNGWERGLKNDVDGGYYERERGSQAYIAEVFGWAVARYGDVELAMKMSEVLDQRNPLRIVILAELGARVPETQRDTSYIKQAERLLEADEVFVGICEKLSEALGEVDPQLAQRFKQRLEEYDYFRVGWPLAKVKDILASGSMVEASRIISEVIRDDLASPVWSYPPAGPKHELERMLVEVAKTDPQRVAALVDDNFRPSAKMSETALIKLKTDVLVEGAKSLIEAGQVRQAKGVLQRALVLARSMETVKERGGSSATREIATESDFRDPVLMKFKAWALAKVGAAAAKLEEVSPGL